MNSYARYIQIGLICLIPLSLSGCMTAFFAEQAIAQVRPMPAASWYLRFKLEGMGETAAVVMQAPGLGAPVSLDKMSFNDFDYGASPGTSLPAEGALEFTIEAEGREPRRVRLDLASMLTEPLNGHVRVFAKPENVRVVLSEYTGWKRVSYNTGNLHRATRYLRAVEVPYLPPAE